MLVLLEKYVKKRNKERCLGIAPLMNETQLIMNTPNWQKHSKKDKKGRGTCKGKIRARKQSLNSLKRQLNFS